MMNCTTAQSWLFRKIDGELSDSESAELDDHLAKCAACNRGYKLLTLPGRIALTHSPVEPSPFFYQKLRLHIDAEALNIAGWQPFRALVRSMIPAMAGIALALFVVFEYLQSYGPQADLHKTYTIEFISEDQPQGMLIADQGDITYESVMRVIAEREPSRRNQSPK